MIFKILIFLLVIGLILRFFLRFLLPVAAVTRMTHQRIKDINNQYENLQKNSAKTVNKSKQIDEDYIDYEEIK